MGDTVIGANVNIEAGVAIANYRNELDDNVIRIRYKNDVIDTGVEKFGAVIGDDVKIGANATIAPGALIERRSRINRHAHIDQRPASG